MERLVDMIDGEPMLRVPDDYDEDAVEGRIREALSKLYEYEEGEAQKKIASLPLKIGDQAWGIRNFHGCRRAQLGIVHEMFFDHNLNLVIAVTCICRGVYGKTVFSSKEDCEAAIEKLSKRSAPAW